MVSQQATEQLFKEAQKESNKSEKIMMRLVDAMAKQYSRTVAHASEVVRNSEVTQ
jgi:hypothetical protein